MIIVDTSVAIKWFRYDENYHEIAMQIYKNHIENKEQIVIPSLFYIETSNALATNTVLTDKDITEGIEFLYASHFLEEMVTQVMLSKAALLAKKYNTSVYDMIYAVLAEKKQTILVTADTKFASKIKSPFVKVLSAFS